MSEDESEEPVEVAEQEKPEPEPDRPSWYNPQTPVQAKGDSLHVAVSAVSADSADAGKMANRTMEEYIENAVTLIISEMLEGDNEFEETGSGNPDRLRSLHAINGKDVMEGLSYRESTFSWKTENHWRFYLMRAYLTSDVKAAIAELAAQ